jgi:two-component system NtrC family response regulator
MSAAQILIVDDEPEVCNFFRHLLTRKGYAVTTVTSGAETQTALEHHFDLALVDLKLPDCDGLSLLRQIKASRPHCEVIIMTGYSTVKSAVESIRLGAYDYIEKPFEDIEKLENLIDSALQCDADPQGDQVYLPQCDMVVGNSYHMRQVLAFARKIAKKNLTVLIQGETGCGKEVMARYIHALSHRANQPFIPVNCGAFTETLLDSELFGHEKGSFTGASSVHRGVFELANNGSLFLDEIGAASPAIQIKLLRVLETREFFRVGGELPLRTDVRIIAATNEDLRQGVQEKTFREDLFYRLDVATIHIPPLRSRLEDIPVFVDFFLERLARENPGVPAVTKVSPEAMALFTAYSWPGNIRELSNVVTQACALCDGNTLQVRHLPPKLMRYHQAVRSLRSEAIKEVNESDSLVLPPLVDELSRTALEMLSGKTVNLPWLQQQLKETQAKILREIITRTLKESMGDYRSAAKTLGTTSRVLRYLLHEQGKDRPRKKTTSPSSNKTD